MRCQMSFDKRCLSNFYASWHRPHAKKSSSKNAGEIDLAFIPSSIPYGRRILPFRGLAFSNFLVLGSATRGFEAVPLLCKLCVDVVVCLVRDCLRLVLVVVVEAEDSVSSFTRSPL